MRDRLANLIDYGTYAWAEPLGNVRITLPGNEPEVSADGDSEG